MDSQNKQESFKIYFGSDNADIRRVTLRSEKFSDVIEQLYKLYGESTAGKSNPLYHPELRVQYEDEEGDKITVSTQREWEEMWATVGSKRPVKIFIVEGPNPSKYFKDGPAPEVKYAYQSPQEESTSNPSEGAPSTTTVDSNNEVIKQLEISVPQCLERLFPGGKILPHHLPEWLKGALTVRHVPNASPADEVELDVNVDLLIDALHNEALKNIGEDQSKDQLEKAKLYLETLLALKPDDARALYNLSCAESLMGNVESAVEALDKAVNAGYTNVVHMAKDSDLDNIRESDGYIRIVERLRTPVPANEEEKVEKKEEQVVDQQPIVTEVVTHEVKEEEKSPVVVAEEPAKVVEEQIENKQPQQQEEVVEEKKVEVEEKKPAKQVETRFPEALRSLEGMGFDPSLCAFLLDENNGDIPKVLEILFGSAQ